MIKYLPLIPALLLVGCGTSPVKGPVALTPKLAVAPAVSGPIGQPTIIQPTEPTRPASPAVSGSGDVLVLSKETLVAGKSSTSQNVTLRKVITSNEVSVPVDLTVEGYAIEHLKPANEVPDFSPKEIGLSYSRDNAGYSIKQEVVDVVKLNKTTSVEPSSVKAVVRTESFEIVK